MKIPRMVALFAAGAALFTAIAGASPGSKLWSTRYDGPADQDDYAASVAVSADGTRVFVTGESEGEAPRGGTT